MLPVPQHIAIIMDGNGRWAARQGLPRLAGHRKGVQTVKAITEAAGEYGVRFLTLYAFSTENWNRPQLEVSGLMTLLVTTIKKEIKALQKNNVRLMTIGNMAGLPLLTRQALMEGIENTSSNTGLTLVLALNYSARWELTEAMKAIAQKVVEGTLLPDSINEKTIEAFLCTQGIPEPELLIRTSGECRISNFLLWQIAYSELYFTGAFWPEFTKEHFIQAIDNYRKRERRFGLTSEQLM
jgi:undecaprenyl diphosphate synthase